MPSGQRSVDMNSRHVSGSEKYRIASISVFLGGACRFPCSEISTEVGVSTILLPKLDTHWDGAFAEVATLKKHRVLTTNNASSVFEAESFVQLTFDRCKIYCGRSKNRN